MMAGNQYGQQWPPNAEPQYQYDNRNDQRQWQENGRGQGSHNQDYQRYNEHPQNRNGYGPGAAPAPLRNDQHAQWQGQDQGQDQQNQYGGYEEPHYDQGHGASRPPRRDHYEQGAPQPRQYQYDERYRTNGQGRPPHPEHSYSDGPRSQRGEWSSPPTPQKRSRPRDRILKEPTSPKNLAWDNPFGAFQPKKKPGMEKEQRHERHASLDHAMATLNMNDRRNSGGPVPRPQTSNNNRREAPRPSTSHDRRPDIDRPPPPPQPLPQAYSAPVGMDSPEMNFQQMPVQRPPPQSQGYPTPPGRDSPEMKYQQAPMPRPQGGISSPRMRPSGPGPSRGQAPPGPPLAPQQPMNQDRPRPDPGPYGARDEYRPQPQQNAQGQYPPQDRRRNNLIHDEGYASDHIPQSRAHVSPIDRVQASNPYPPPRQQDFHQNSYRGPPENPGKQNQRMNDGLPNFDAIPTHVNEKSEDNLIANQQPKFDQSVYRKPTYQLPGSFPGQPNPIDTNQSHPSPPNQTTSPLAEFSFNLPLSNHAVSADRNGNPAQVGPYRGGYNAHLPSSRAAPGVYGDSQPQELPAGQYPPRAASRSGMKPVLENDASRPPVPNNGPPYRSFSQDQYPARPHTSNAQRPAQQSYEAMNPYDQDPMNRAPSAPAASILTDQGYGPSSHNPRNQQPYGQGPPNRKASRDNYTQNQQFQQPYEQVSPMRKISQDNYNQGPPNPSAQDNYNQGPPKPTGAASAHPVPVRHYPNPNPNVNPDSLPAHPTPVRGISNNSNGYPPAQPLPAQTPQRRDVSGPAPPVTLQELSGLRGMYSSNPNDYALGLKLAKKMVEAAKVLSDENGKADAKTTQKNREKYILDAHKLIKKLVASNYPDAMFYLADCHGQGMLGLAVDPKEAFTLYQSAAKLNHPQSAYRVAVCCELGSEEGGGTRRDPLKAMQWYKRAATLGDTPAMYKLGMILLKGLLSQQKNPREAVSWLKRAAERADKDNPHALHELGLLYESATPPDNILRDERYAFQLFQQAAELGYKYSQFRLGSAFEYGLLDCPIDARQSIAWYTRSAAQGEHQSELALSGWYLTGSEPLLTQSDNEAFLWARKAASSGLAKAEYAMGYFNEVGIGTGVDVEEAKRWYYRAASQNFAKARERLEELKRGGPKQQKTRMSRSNVTRQSDGDCVVM